MIEETRFRQIVAHALRELSAQVDEIPSDAFDSRLADGVFQVEWEEGGVFVLSQQVPVRELWLSAFSRAWHFQWVDGRWLERDSNEPMADILTEHFSRKLGKPYPIRDPGPAE